MPAPRTRSRDVLGALEDARAWEPRIEAWAYLAEPDELAAAWPATEGHGRLQGVPFAVKDIIDVAGLPTRNGSARFADAGPTARDAAVVAALRRDGAIAIGKTRTTEFAFIDPTITRNPYDPRHTPGGSSSGSGAVVGAGIVPFALGTQTAGSLIRPACYSGVTAFKPSLGLLPTEGVAPLARSFDQVGIIAQSFDWIERALPTLESVITRTVDPVAVPPRERLNLAILTVPEQSPQAEQVAAFDAATARFADLGHTIDRRPSPVAFGDLLDQHRTIMLFEATRDLTAFLGGSRHGLQPKLTAALDEGARIGEDDYRRALDRLVEARALFWRALDGVDLILAHPVPGAAPRDLTQTGDQSYLSPWTALGGPLTCAPIGLDAAGMPLAMMFAAAPDRDRDLIAQSSALASALPSIPRPRREVSSA